VQAFGITVPEEVQWLIHPESPAFATGFAERVRASGGPLDGQEVQITGSSAQDGLFLHESSRERWIYCWRPHDPTTGDLVPGTMIGGLRVFVGRFGRRLDGRA
jgi:hypothetical protein